MSIKRNKVYLLFVISFLLVFSGNIYGQLRISSPYSRYGLGELQDNNFSRNLSMGGIGYCVRDSLFINTLNPASYTRFDSLSFLCEIGLNSDFDQLQTINTTQGFTNHTTLGYFLFGFPVTRWWGASAGLVPYSRSGYQMTSTDTIAGPGIVNSSYTGNGGLNRFFIGSGFKIYKELSVGFNASFLFGTINNKSTVIFNSLLPYVFNTRITHSTVVSDFNLETGLQYHHDFNKHYFLNGGLVWKVPMTMSARQNDLVERITVSGETEIAQDTIENILNQKGKIYLPGGIGGGIAVGQNGIWMLGVDVGWQNWKKFRSFGKSESLKSTLHGAIGFSILPKNKTNINYFKRMTYSAGARFNNLFLELHDQPINEYAISVGFNFPIGISKTKNTGYSINLGLEYGQRGTTKNNLIKENFIRASIGFIIKESWFFRPKID
jgi:hypothetical protein